MRALLITLSASALLACGSVESDEKSHIKEKHGNGLTKTEWRYSGNDSLNRTQVEYHANGEVFKTGQLKDGVRFGDWKSFYPNGQIWSEQSYFNGRRDGPTKTWFENGQLRYEGAYANDERFGRWVFYNEQGDTVKVADF